MIPHITIDGPTASGKGTVAQGVASALGWNYLDSGAIYRACALFAMDEDLPLTEVERVAKLAQGLPLRFAENSVFLKHDDVTTAIRAEAIGNAASQISAAPAVRAALLQRQRDFLQAPGLATDGRDMGTVVFPDAPLKVFLTANVAVRAQRRYLQLTQSGVAADLAAITRDLEERDHRDRTRSIAPLEPTPTSKLIDTSELTAQQAIDRILTWWQAR